MNSKAAPSIKDYGEFLLKLSNSNKIIFINTLYCVGTQATDDYIAGFRRAEVPYPAQNTTLFYNFQQFTRITKANKLQAGQLFYFEDEYTGCYFMYVF